MLHLARSYSKEINNNSSDINTLVAINAFKESNGADKRREKKNIEMGKINRILFFEDTLLNEKLNSNVTHNIEFMFQKMVVSSYCQCILTLISLFSFILYYELTIRKYKSNVILATEYISMISSIGLIINIILEYLIENEKYHLIHKLPKSIYSLDFYSIFFLLVKLVIFIFHANPIFHSTICTIFNDRNRIYQEFTLNSIFGAISLFRIWFVFKAYVMTFEYSSSRTFRICQMKNFEVDFYFSIKGVLSKNPIQVYSFLMIIFIFFYSYNLRIFENGLNSEETDTNLDNFIVSVWCVIITMTTVGFGDYYPSSGIGRVIGILSCISGVFLISMLVVTIASSFNLSDFEENIYNIIKKVDLETEKINKAKILLETYVKSLKNIKFKEKTKDEFKPKFLKSFNDFKKVRQDLEAFNPELNKVDYTLKSLDCLDKRIKKLDIQQDKIVKLLGEISTKLS